MLILLELLPFGDLINKGQSSLIWCWFFSREFYDLKKFCLGCILRGLNNCTSQNITSLRLVNIDCFEEKGVDEDISLRLINIGVH